MGSNRPISVDVRVVAATNRDLKVAMEAGQFREDLFYRLNVFQIPIPPLRSRADDIPVLARYFLERQNQRLGKSITGFTPGAQIVLMNYEFPGNIRELENAIERAAVLVEGNRITEYDLPPEMAGRGVPRLVHTPEEVYPVELSLKEVEDRHIQRVLEHHGGNATRAAKALGISRATLWRKLKRLDGASS